MTMSRGTSNGGLWSRRCWWRLHGVVGCRCWCRQVLIITHIRSSIRDVAFHQTTLVWRLDHNLVSKFFHNLVGTALAQTLLVFGLFWCFCFRRTSSPTVMSLCLACRLESTNSLPVSFLGKHNNGQFQCAFRHKHFIVAPT